MKKSRIAVAIAASTMLSAPAFATNGDHLIGLGAQARAMGGTGTAAYFGSENALSNPALLGKSQGSEFAIGGTLFMPKVKAERSMGGGTSFSETSDADQSIIPEVSMYNRINDNWTFGLGMFGTAGMGVDYSDSDDLFNATSNLELMRFAPTMAYNNDRFGFGLGPVLQYGALDLNYTNPMTDENEGSGVANDLQWGFNLGGYYDVTPDLTLGMAYQSAISMEYGDQITGAADGFGIGPDGMAVITSNKLEQPAEIKVGVAYNLNNWLLSADYKQIQWGKAEGYKDFNWQDQDVYAIGARYNGNNYWVGLGYNYGKDPIKVLGGNAYEDQAVDMFNNHFFPAVVEQHFTLGGGYKIGKKTTIEGAIVYAPEVSKEIDVSAVTGAPDSTHEVKHSQMSYTFSVRMNF